jgi:hypothetical protein
MGDGSCTRGRRAPSTQPLAPGAPPPFLSIPFPAAVRGRFLLLVWNPFLNGIVGNVGPGRTRGRPLRGRRRRRAVPFNPQPSGTPSAAGASSHQLLATAGFSQPAHLSPGAGSLAHSGRRRTELRGALFLLACPWPRLVDAPLPPAVTNHPLTACRRWAAMLIIQSGKRLVIWSQVSSMRLGHRSFPTKRPAPPWSAQPNTRDDC